MTKRLPSSANRLHTLIRLLWLLVILSALVLTVTAIPHRFAMLAADVYGYGEAITDQGLSYSWFAGYFTTLETAISIAFVIVATVIAWGKTGEWFALMVAAILAFMGVLLPLADGLIYAEDAWSWSIIGIRFAVYTGMIAVLCLFPDGQFKPRWSRWILLAWFLFAIFNWSFITKTFSDMAIIPNTRSLQDGLTLLVLAAWAGAGAAMQLIRYRSHATTEQRQQMKWVLLGFVLLTAASIANAVLLTLFSELRQTGASNVIYVLLGGTLILGAALCLAVTIAVAIFRHRLFDIDIVINRSLVYGGLTGITLGIYVLTVVGLGALLQRRYEAAVPLVATGIVAILFQPLRVRLQLSVDRLMYGKRDDPVGMLNLLARRLETVDRPERILPTLVETIASTLKLPYVAIWLPRNEQEGDRATEMRWKPVAAIGQQSQEDRVIPLFHQNQEIGRLYVSPRGPGERFSREDERLLTTIAQLSATTVQAVQLSLELRTSQRMLVTSREEERRRLRRDLHDGLGPVLASIALQADTAFDLVESDPGETQKILNSIMDQSHAAVVDVRRLVYGLRPPALDELGLVGALRQSARGYRHELAIKIESDELPPLPAAVEVAAFRIVQEAMNNAIQHAKAQTCNIMIRIGDRLKLVIEDDGIGVVMNAVSGVGTLSMKERAAELGGYCVIENRPSGGTRIEALLPIRLE